MAREQVLCCHLRFIKGGLAHHQALVLFLIDCPSSSLSRSLHFPTTTTHTHSRFILNSLFPPLPHSLSVFLFLRVPCSARRRVLTGSWHRTDMALVRAVYPSWLRYQSFSSWRSSVSIPERSCHCHQPAAAASSHLPSHCLRLRLLTCAASFSFML